MLAENLLISVINVFKINNIDTRSIILFFLLLTYVTSSTIFRSSRRRYSIRKGVLKSSRKFTGKHQCQSLFFKKVAALRTATLLKKRLRHRCFPVNFTKFLRTPFFTVHLWVTASEYLAHNLKFLLTTFNLYSRAGYPGAEQSASIFF